MNNLLMIVPALSIIFSKKILYFSSSSSKLFFTIFAWTLIFLGFSAIFFAMLPELSLVRAEFFSFVPKIIVESFSQVPKISYFIFAFIDFTLALVLLFADKSVSWRAFSRSILAMLVISWTLNFTVYPHIIFVEVDNIMEEVEVLQIEEYEENSAILDEGKALLEQSESILENGKYYLQLPKSLLPDEKSENELYIPELHDPLEGIIPFTPPTFEPQLPPQIPLEDLLELNNPNLPTYSL